MRYDDLSAGALQGALTDGQGTSLVYLFRFFDGFQPGGAAAYYEARPVAVRGERLHDHRAQPAGQRADLRGRAPPIQGDVDAAAGTIRLSVPPRRSRR